ncbi:MAG: YceI family protein [Bacteroidota bacterium]|nr:YceI family protein [Bacteroidota bacterium]
MNFQKQLFSLTAILAIASLSFKSPETTNPVSTYKVDPNNSTIVWKGKKVTGEHTGTIDISKGKINVDGKKITGGEFEINMETLANTDLTDPESNTKLVGHLKSDDFFGTDKHKSAKFVIKEATSIGNNKYDVKGDLTIKGKTNEISFPATIVDKGNELEVNANIVVDRAKYDVKYGSGSFFDNLGDKMIYDDFELEVKLVAEKNLAAK